MNPKSQQATLPSIRSHFVQYWRRRVLETAIAALVATTAGPPAFAVDVVACGQAVPRGEVAELRADLRCGPVGAAVALGTGAALNLNGFSLVGQDGSQNAGLLCVGPKGCTIEGPGEVRGFGAGLSGSGRVRVRNVTFRHNRIGVTTKGAIVDFSNVIANENETGIVAAGAGRLSASDVQVSNNRRAGIWVAGTRRVRLSRVTAVGNGKLGGGLYLGTRGRGRVLIVDSTITGNDGLGQGYDVLTTLRNLRLFDSACGQGAYIRVSRTLPEITTIIRPLGCRGD